MKCDFKIGDIVTRNGTDEHLIMDINEPGDLIHVQCLSADPGGIYQVGDEEWNIPTRYDFVRSSVDIQV